MALPRFGTSTYSGPAPRREDYRTDGVDTMGGFAPPASAPAPSPPDGSYYNQGTITPYYPATPDISYTGASSGGPEAGGTATTTTTTTASGLDELGLTGPQRNAYDALVKIYESYGLGELAPIILGYVQRGITDGATIEILLRQESAFKTRFKVNETRLANGYNALSIAEILNLENRYKSIMASSGLPTSFWDSRDDFHHWIANDVAPAEIEERILMAQETANSADPLIKQALSQFYNLGEGDLVAYFLDQNRAQDIWTQRRVFRGGQIGAEAMRQGLGTSRDRIDYFVGAGVSQEAARQGFGEVAHALPRAEFLSSIHGGEDVDQRVLEDENILGLASARRARERLRDSELALWSGSAGRTGNRNTSTSGLY